MPVDPNGTIQEAWETYRKEVLGFIKDKEVLHEFKKCFWAAAIAATSMIGCKLKMAGSKNDREIFEDVKHKVAHMCIEFMMFIKNVNVVEETDAPPADMRPEVEYDQVHKRTA